MNLAEFTHNFNRSAIEAKTPMARVELIAGLLGTAFGTGREEVAIFSFDKSREILVFIWPQSLKSVGSIPLNAHRCLVSKTAVEQKGWLDNSFASTPHLYMFEHFLSDKVKRVPIQKIMSIPVMSGETLKGVIQIARKGLDRDGAGTDFTPADLTSLTSFGAVVADYL